MTSPLSDDDTPRENPVKIKLELMTVEKSPLAKSTDLLYAKIRLLIVVLAVCIAYANNRSGDRLYPIIAALFFSEIYLAQFFVRYFILQEPGYGLKYGHVMKAHAPEAKHVKTLNKLEPAQAFGCEQGEH